MKNKQISRNDGISDGILKGCSPIFERYIVKPSNKYLEKRNYSESFEVVKIEPFY